MIERVKVEMCREVTEKGRAPWNVHKQSQGVAASVTAPLNCAKSQEAKLYVHGHLRFPFWCQKFCSCLIVTHWGEVPSLTVKNK